MSEVGSIGHNSVASLRLKSFLERVESIEAGIKELQDDRKEVYAEAKGEGFDVPTIKAIVKLRKVSPDERAEKEVLLQIYMHALGMLADTPLGEAAAKAKFGDGQADIEDAIARKESNGSPAAH